MCEEKSEIVNDKSDSEHVKQHAPNTFAYSVTKLLYVCYTPYSIYGIIMKQ